MGMECGGPLSGPGASSRLEYAVRFTGAGREVEVTELADPTDHREAEVRRRWVQSWQGEVLKMPGDAEIVVQTVTKSPWRPEQETPGSGDRRTRC